MEERVMSRHQWRPVDRWALEFGFRLVTLGTHVDGMTSHIADRVFEWGSQDTPSLRSAAVEFTGFVDCIPSETAPAELETAIQQVQSAANKLQDDLETFIGRCVTAIRERQNLPFRRTRPFASEEEVSVAVLKAQQRQTKAMGHAVIRLISAIDDKARAYLAVGVTLAYLNQPSQFLHRLVEHELSQSKRSRLLGLDEPPSRAQWRELHHCDSSARQMQMRSSLAGRALRHLQRQINQPLDSSHAVALVRQELPSRSAKKTRSTLDEICAYLTPEREFAIENSRAAGPVRGRRRGRRGADEETRRDEAEIVRQWKRARDAGTSKAEFAASKGMTADKLEALINRDRKRQKQRSE